MSDKAKRQPAPSMNGLRITGGIIKVFFLTILRLIVTMMMVGIITGCIVASVLTVYVLRYIGAEDEISLETLKLGYTSIIYAVNPQTGQEEELQRLYNVEGNRIWVNYEDINEYTRKALVAIEDKRFWEHDGVDWRRTFGAFANLFIPGASTGGGSTVHQQLIKNVTGDDDYRIDRKVREIFRAINLGQNYTHEQVLEAYLNVVPFGNNTNGIQAAANTYFDKDAMDLTLAESAAIVGITQKPTAHNPFFFPEANKDRQEHVLFEMHDQGLITDREYEQALKEPLKFKRSEHYESVYAVQSYFVDHVIEQVIEDLMDLYGWDYSEAEEHLYQDGYHIYTTVDLDVQSYLEDFYSDVQNFIDAAPVLNAEYPQSASVILEPNGRIVAMVGGIGEKPVSRSFNRATMAKRHPGSSIKPLGVYALAFEYDRISWSTVIEDSPIDLASPGQAPQPYPVNYYGGYLGPVTVDYAVRRSVNTIPVKLAQMLTPRTVFDFLRDDLNMYSLIESATIDGGVYSDVSIGPMALGSMTEGITPLEMAGGYQIFLNGGNFTKPYCYYRVEDSDGRVILQPDITGTPVISESTSVVLNKLLQRVTNAEWGTGQTANFPGMPTGGKTGTSSDDVDQWFIGFTPYYICQVWLGYDSKTPDNNYGEIRYYNYSPPLLWRAIMQPLHEDLEPREFMESPDVIRASYCSISGDAAGPGCPVGGEGYYKTSFPLRQCSGVHGSTGEASSGDDEQEAGGSGETGGGSGDSGEGGGESGGQSQPSGGGSGSQSQPSRTPAVRVDWPEADT